MTRRRPHRLVRRHWKPAAAVAVLALGGAAAHELPYANWRRLAAPVDGRLVIRHDAKGSGHFGAPRSGNRTHRGIDLQAPLETPVRAIRSGRVLEAETHKGLGRYVVIQHADDLRSLYAHLHDITVREGERVKQGQQIGSVGKTGNARHRWIEPHLHLEIVQAGTALDPVAFGLYIPDDAVLASEPEEPDARGGE
jgi:murein DD-endopeptidase MepM/ murein hydrolase activator NlpD